MKHTPQICGPAVGPATARGMLARRHYYGWPPQTRAGSIGASGPRETAMEHRWGHRLSASIPVRLRCLQARDRGCRCLGCIENVSTTGALIRTELGICPAAAIAIEVLAPALGLAERALPA